MLFSFISLETIGALLFGSFVIAAMAITVELESTATATAVTLISLAASTLLFGFPSWDWIVANPLAAVSWVVLYVVLGGIWSTYRWYRYVREKDVSDHYQMWKKLNPGKTLADYAVSDSNPLNVMRNKSRIMRWMIWWVPSLLDTLFRDVFENIWTWVYSTLAGVYHRIMVSSLEKRLK